jgi:hypothetical protein
LNVSLFFWVPFCFFPILNTVNYLFSPVETATATPKPSKIKYEKCYYSLENCRTLKKSEKDCRRLKKKKTVEV